MTARPVDPAEMARTIDAVEKTRRGDGTTNFTEAAKVLGIHRATVISRFNARGAARVEITQPTPRERFDAEFWKRKNAEISEELIKTQHLLDEISGLAKVPNEPAKWATPSGYKGKRAKAAVCCLVTDIHMGEVVEDDAILGLNKFNPDICTARLRRYFGAACEIGHRWTSDCTPAGAVVIIGGDLISGNLHWELEATNALTSQEQCLAVASELAAGLKHLAKSYGKVHSVWIGGNHDRGTPKPTSKLYARLSYATLVAKFVYEMLKDDKRISFQIPNARDAVVPVLGKTIFATHGDGMGSGGGQGFAGPILPIIRGSKKVELQQFRAKRPYDLLVHGHFHHSANAPGVLSNGSVPGYTEYGNSFRASLEPPQQWLFLMHERWGLRERLEVQLEEPRA